MVAPVHQYFIAARNDAATDRYLLRHDRSPHARLFYMKQWKSFINPRDGITIREEDYRILRVGMLNTSNGSSPTCLLRVGLCRQSEPRKWCKPGRTPPASMRRRRGANVWRL